METTGAKKDIDYCDRKALRRYGFNVTSNHWPLSVERRFTSEYSKLTLPSHSQMRTAVGGHQRQFRFEKCSSQLCICDRNVKPVWM